MMLQGAAFDLDARPAALPLVADGARRLRDVHVRGGMVPSDDDLLERTLAFSGSYASDDGHVTIRRARGASPYSGAQFTGTCTVCARAGLLPPEGELLADLTAAAQFAAVHGHDEVD
jgi:hypothetical protein